jgi:ATP-dependent Clp protease adapter protein ClpS
MPAEPGIAEPWTETRELPRHDEDEVTNDDGPSVVILYNDDYHAVDEVVSQIQKATGYAFERCVGIMLEAHTRGRSIAYTGSQEACERVAVILRQIRLQVETDKF